MLDRLEYMENRYEELSHILSDPEVIGRQEEWQRLVKEHSDLEAAVVKYREYKQNQQGIADARLMLSEGPDPDMKALIEQELAALTQGQAAMTEALKVLLLPKDPLDDKNVVMEIRGGAGGEEAALFGAVLFRMYTRYAERQGWRTEVLSANYTELNGIKEIIFLIEGAEAYSRLKYESGVHRVQRIPTTESGGRIHTSTATVAVLPEAEDVDITINPADLRIDVFRSSGHGGQSVNTTDSAVRITHLPTGQVVSCQDEKSQLKNKEKALRVLKARLLDMEKQQKEAEYAQNRKSQVGTGDRSERIRTYNYPQGRVSDHRIGLTLYQLEAFLDGDLQEMLEVLSQAEQTEKLKAAEA